MLSLANALYTEQLGVYISAHTLVLNVDESASFEAGGPNYAPVEFSGPDSPFGRCAEPASPGRQELWAKDLDSGGARTRVGVDGLRVLLSELGVWAQQHAPERERLSSEVAGGRSAVEQGAPAVWHLLTDCAFGAALGVAAIGVACRPAFAPLGVRDTGEPCRQCALGEDGKERCAECDFRLPNGHAAAPHDAEGECRKRDELCNGGHIGLTTFLSTEKLWRTFAHEIGHNLGAPHSAKGIMAATLTSEQDPRFEDDFSMCRYLREHGSCLETGERACGNGRAEAPEECDDGNQREGDGCDNKCRREGPDASSPPPSGGGSSTLPPAPPPSQRAGGLPPSPPPAPPNGGASRGSARECPPEEPVATLSRVEIVLIVLGGLLCCVLGALVCVQLRRRGKLQNCCRRPGAPSAAPPAPANGAAAAGASSADPPPPYTPSAGPAHAASSLPVVMGSLVGVPRSGAHSTAAVPPAATPPAYGYAAPVGQPARAQAVAMPLGEAPPTVTHAAVPARVLHV